MKKSLLMIFMILSSFLLMGQKNGNFQMHFINVGQGDAALLISPGGETVLFDEGVVAHCDVPVEYLDLLGITSIDYMVTSHYHQDHIGCTKQILEKFPLKKIAYDRGEMYPSDPFDLYQAAVGTKRQKAVPGQRFTLDPGSGHEVVITFLALNGAGIETDNENDLSLVSLVKFGDLEIMMGGDLSGFNASNYKDIESKLAGNAPRVEVYKVHHHCSQYSSNTTWLNAIRPRIGIINVVGEYGKGYGLPAEDCMERLHKAGIKTYWTNIGDGADPDPMWDIVGGNIVVAAAPGSHKFTVSFNGSNVHTYPDWGYNDTSVIQTDATYGWSRNSEIYHYLNCSFIKKIKLQNLETGSKPPDGKTLHPDCPK
ncbi:MAG: MBL fold metallo-hydrolase [Bacteroidetes bacterium]|nr:MBL fold metallo-hydrolase [Bacteroidota bacterium]